jgi:hypothetical protein
VLNLVNVVLNYVSKYAYVFKHVCLIPLLIVVYVVLSIYACAICCYAMVCLDAS